MFGVEVVRCLASWDRHCPPAHGIHRRHEGAGASWCPGDPGPHVGKSSAMSVTQLSAVDVSVFFVALRLASPPGCL